MRPAIVARDRRTKAKTLAGEVSVRRYPAWYALTADSGSLVSVYSAISAAPVRVFAPIAASVAGALARAVVVSLGLPAVALAAGGPVLASAAGSGVPVPA